jgi:alpha-1,2-mannosyltransferase
MRHHPATALAALLAAASLACWLFGWHVGLDSAVYRSGASAVLHGDPLYGPLPGQPSWPGAPTLPFTYPPFAALLFTPFALLPPQLTWGVLAALSALALGFVLRVSLGGGAKSRQIAAYPAILACAFGLEPVWLTLSFGQVNLLLMALVVLDVLVLPPSRRRGVLTGLAAAIKLTPLVFVLHLALTGRRQDAVRALATFAALNLAGAVALPADTARFWRSQLLGGNDATRNSWVGNQSLNGVIQRLTNEANWAFTVAVLAGLACIGAALLLARRLHAHGEHLSALLVTAFGGVLASPISWSHHWVWVVALAGLLVRRAAQSRSTGPALALATLALVFTGWTLAVVPSDNHRELHWTAIQMMLGNAYVLVALAAAPFLFREVFRSDQEQLS